MAGGWIGGLTGIKGGGGLEKYLGGVALKPFIDTDLILEKMVPCRLPMTPESPGRPQCDHARGIHLRPVVLTTWREGDLVTGVNRYARVRCYACGRKWTEEA